MLTASKVLGARGQTLKLSSLLTVGFSARPEIPSDTMSFLLGMVRFLLSWPPRTGVLQNLCSQPPNSFGQSQLAFSNAVFPDSPEASLMQGMFPIARRLAQGAPVRQFKTSIVLACTQ